MNEINKNRWQTLAGIKSPKLYSINEAKEDEETDDEALDALTDLEDTELSDESSDETFSDESTGETSEVQDYLEAAMEAAKALGDSKLETQIGNTIVYLNRSQYSSVDEGGEDLFCDKDYNGVEIDV